MATREYAASVRRHIDAPPAVVWALVADTNRFDRASGLSPASYSFVETSPGDPRTRARVARARQMGIAIRWLEPPYQWVEGRYVEGERQFLEGPVSRGGLRVTLAPEGRGTTLEATAYVAGEGIAASVVGTVMRARLGAGVRRYLEAIERVLHGVRDKLAAAGVQEPSIAWARRTLALAPTDAVASGVVSPTREDELTHRARSFADAPVPPALREHLLDLLRTRPDEDLTEIRPFELARAWSSDRRATLATFLHAARAGLVDLHWQVNCPTCRVGAQVAGSLSDVGRRAHCESCNIGFDPDFGEHVEAVFRVSPALRTVQPALYCASSPWFRPHVFAQLSLEPGAVREFRLEAPSGELLARTLAGARRARVTLTDPPPATLQIDVGPDALTLTPAGTSTDGETRVTFASRAAEPVVLLLERAGWNADIALGSVVATLPEFLDLFATDAPASGVELSVGTLTLLFSDLTGSTALYERVGDARAFAVVEEHFRDMTAAVARHDGAIVKTMGDAVMAAFHSPASALRAALEMVSECARVHGGLGLSAKLGLYEGPCLAVRANDRLDFFGTTVNVAARLQAKAEGGQVVIAARLLEHPEVARIVREQGLRLTRFEAGLKGIAATQQLVALEAGEAGRPVPSAGASESRRE